MQIPFQRNIGGIVALLPDGRVEFFHPKAESLIGDINRGIAEFTSEHFDPLIISDPVVDADSFHLSAPAIAFLELTNKCNLSCLHCYASSGRARDGELSFEEICRLLDVWESIGVLQVFLTGGELFTRSDISEIMCYARKKRFSLQIFTNGLLVPRELLARLEPTSFFISFDTAVPERTVRGGMDFPKLRRLFEMFEEYGHPFRTAVSVHSLNVCDVEEIFQWCYENGFPRPQWLETHPVGRALLNQDILLPPERVDEVFAIYKRCMQMFSVVPQEFQESDATEVGNRIAPVNMREIATIKFCQRLEKAIGYEKCARSTVYVASDGSVYPCTNCMSANLFCGGNIRSNAFEKIWAGGFQDIRKIGFQEYTVCQQCPVDAAGAWCQFRCPPLAKNITGNTVGCGATEYLQKFMLKAHNFWEERRSKGIKLRL